jgi:thiaminase
MTTATMTPFSRNLTSANSALVTDIAACDWVRGVATNTLPGQAFINWAGQCAWFCRLERAALHHLLSLDPPRDLEGLLETLLADTEREPRQLEEELTRRGARMPGKPWPVCRGYGRDVQGFARQGLAEGTAAIFGVEWFYYTAWLTVEPKVAADSPYHPWVSNWTNPDFGALVTALGESLDDLMGWTHGRTPTAEACERTEAAFTAVGEWELAFWNMCSAGADWPSVGVRS